MNGLVAGNEAGSEGLATAPERATEAFSTGREGGEPVPAADAEADCGDDVDVAEAEDEPREHQLPSGRRTGAPCSRRASVSREMPE